jgi:hypothetical protein
VGPGLFQTSNVNLLGQLTTIPLDEIALILPCVPIQIESSSAPAVAGIAIINIASVAAAAAAPKSWRNAPILP